MSFDNLWQQLYDHGATNTRRAECAELWESLDDKQQEQLFTTISTKLKAGKFVHFDPLRAMQENIHKLRPQTLSFDEYYKRYGTTEEQDGWRRVFLPEEHKTIYVK